MKIDRKFVITILVIAYLMLIITARIGPLNTTMDLQRRDDVGLEFVSTPLLKLHNIDYHFTNGKTIRPGEQLFYVGPSDIWQNEENYLGFELFNRMPISSNFEVEIKYKTDKCFQPITSVSSGWKFGQDANKIKFGRRIESYKGETIRIELNCAPIIIESVTLIWDPVL